MSKKQKLTEETSKKAKPGTPQKIRPSIRKAPPKLRVGDVVKLPWREPPERTIAKITSLSKDNPPRVWLYDGVEHIVNVPSESLSLLPPDSISQEFKAKLDTPQGPTTPPDKAKQSPTTLEASIKIAEDLRDAVLSLGHRCSWEKNAIQPLLFYPDEDVKKVQECTGKFLQMYDEWATKLCLTYQPWDFHLHQMWEDKNGLFTRIKEVIERLKTLRDKAGGGATETPKERQKRNSVRVRIGKEDVTLTRYEALCLMALKKELENRPEYIRTVHILMKVWPGETLKGGNLLKYYWSNLRKKLETKGYKLPGFEHLPSKYEGYCLGTKDTPWKPPAQFKKIRFPQDLKLPPVVKPNHWISNLTTPL